MDALVVSRLTLVDQDYQSPLVNVYEMMDIMKPSGLMSVNSVIRNALLVWQSTHIPVSRVQIIML